MSETRGGFLANDYTCAKTFNLEKLEEFIELYYQKLRKGGTLIMFFDIWKISQLKDLMDGCNKIHKSIPGEKKPVKEEISTMKFAFASVVSTKEIKKGEKLSHKNIWVKRPGGGDYKSNDYYNLIGKTAKINIPNDSQISKKDILWEY